MTTAEVMPKMASIERTVSRPPNATGESGLHISALDGVRGLAFCLVFFQHFAGGQHIHLRALEAVRGVGWTGVDLFFCLSGFLITGILFDTRHDPHYFRNFYARRALRIFPLYYLCLTLLVLSTPLLHLEWHAFHLCYFLYCSNFLNAFDPAMSTFGFTPWIDIGHFWSLAVEEQFYFIWPGLILLCRSRRAIIRVCFSFIGLSILLRCIFISIYLHAAGSHVSLAEHWLGRTLAAMPAPFFYRTFLYRITLFRFDSLAFGGILAMWMRDGISRQWLNRLPQIAMALLGVSCCVLLLSFHLETPITAALGYTVLAMFYTALIACAINVASVRRVFQMSMLRTIGKYSYGMYILHQIARPTLPLVIGKLAPYVGSIPFAAVLCTAGWFLTVLGLAKLSYMLFESKFLRLKSRFTYEPRPATARGLAPINARPPEVCLPAEPAYSGISH